MIAAGANAEVAQWIMDSAQHRQVISESGIPLEMVVAQAQYAMHAPIPVELEDNPQAIALYRAFVSLGCLPEEAQKYLTDAPQEAEPVDTSTSTPAAPPIQEEAPTSSTPPEEDNTLEPIPVNYLQTGPETPLQEKVEAQQRLQAEEERIIEELDLDAAPILQNEDIGILKNLWNAILSGGESLNRDNGTFDTEEDIAASLERQNQAAQTTSNAVTDIAQEIYDSALNYGQVIGESLGRDDGTYDTAEEREASRLRQQEAASRTNTAVIQKLENYIESLPEEKQQQLRNTMEFTAGALDNTAKVLLARQVAALAIRGIGAPLATGAYAYYQISRLPPFSMCSDREGIRTELLKELMQQQEISSNQFEMIQKWMYHEEENTSAVARAAWRERYLNKEQGWSEERIAQLADSLNDEADRIWQTRHPAFTKFMQSLGSGEAKEAFKIANDKLSAWAESKVNTFRDGAAAVQHNWERGNYRGAGEAASDFVFSVTDAINSVRNLAAKKKSSSSSDTSSSKPKSRSEPILPPKNIAEGNGIKIQHYTRSGDHGPAHLHVKGGGAEVKIGQNGKPLKGELELSAKQQEFIEKNLSEIRKAVKKMQKWHNYQQNLGD